MATPDPAHDGLSTEQAQDERFIAAMCRDARFKNEEIHKKREKLRKEVLELEEAAHGLEGQYWHEYHKRLGDIVRNNPTSSTRGWASAFGKKEKQFSENLVKRQAALHQAARVKRDELRALDGEYWGAWSKHVDFMSGLAPLPPSPGSTPAAMLPDVAQHPTDNSTSAASAASRSDTNRNQGNPDMNSANVKKQSVSGIPSAVRRRSQRQLSIVPTKAESPQGHSPSQTAQGLKGSAMPPAQSASPLVGPSPLSRVSSPDASIPTSASVSKPQRQQLSSTAGASPRDASFPTPQSLTPKSTFAALDSPHEPSQEPADSAQPSSSRRKAAAAEPQHKKTFTPINTVKPPSPTMSNLTAPENQDDGFSGITEPVLGEIYQAYYKDASYEGWWMCTLLPWDAWERKIGFNFTFGKANLFSNWPEHCYTTGNVRAGRKGRKTRKVITGWKAGFEDGGPRARERVFPMFLFEDTEGAPGCLTFPSSPERPYTFPSTALNALPAEWVKAADLRMPGTDVGRPVYGRDTADRYRERFRARRELQAKKKLLGTTPTKSRGRYSGSAVASSPMASSSMDASSAMEDSSAMEASSAVEASSHMGDTTREDTEMADAESLSGDTVVGGTAGQADILDAAKTLAAIKTTPPKKSPPAEETVQGSSGKEWRSVILGEKS